MKNPFFPLLAFLLLFNYGCKKCKCDDPKPDDSGCPKLEKYSDSITYSSNVKIHEARIENETLHLKVAYSACSQTQFRLLWDGNYIKTLPAQVYIGLKGDGNEMACQAYFEDDICFDLNPLRYNKEHGSIKIHLEGYESDSLLYTY